MCECVYRYLVLLQWCESKSECNRQKLKEMLARPMQQLTRYHLLLNAINKKTTNKEHKDRLEKIVSVIAVSLPLEGKKENVSSDISDTIWDFLPQNEI